MSFQPSARQDVKQLPMSALLQEFRDELEQTYYVEATGSSRSCRDLPVFALVSNRGDITTRVFVYRHGGYADEPYHVEVFHEHTDATNRTFYEMNRATANDFIDRLLMRVDYGDLGECCWLNFGHNHSNLVDR